MKDLRIDKLREKMLANGITGAAIMPGANMYYLCGIHAHLSERPVILLVPAAGQPAIIIPTLEASKASAANIPEDRIFSWSDEEGYTSVFQKACFELNLSEYSLGVEAFHMRLLELELLQRYAPGMKIVHLDSLLADMRAVKDLDEIAAIRKAVTVAEAALQQLIPRIEVGQTEKYIASMLIQELMSAGSEGNPFSPIVSAGPNGSSPHAVPTGRPIKSGDLLVIDWGASINGYPSDITRTFAVGEIDPQLQRIYEMVKSANESARQLAGPGVSGQDVDHAARSIIEAAGYGPNFIHRTGHGLGLQGHEPPNMVVGNEEPLVDGVVFTIEPGIYLPEVGGVRIEDDILITSSGSESLTTFTRELIQVG